MHIEKEIRKITVFEALSTETVNRLATCASSLVVEKGKTLFWEKDQVDAVYAVVSGKVAILRHSGNGQKRIFSFWTTVH